MAMDTDEREEDLKKKASELVDEFLGKEHDDPREALVEAVREALGEIFEEGKDEGEAENADDDAATECETQLVELVRDLSGKLISDAGAPRQGARARPRRRAAQGRRALPHGPGAVDLGGLRPAAGARAAARGAVGRLRGDLRRDAQAREEAAREEVAPPRGSAGGAIGWRPGAYVIR